MSISSGPLSRWQLSFPCVIPTEVEESIVRPFSRPCHRCQVARSWFTGFTGPYFTPTIIPCPNHRLALVLSRPSLHRQPVYPLSNRSCRPPKWPKFNYFSPVEIFSRLASAPFFLTRPSEDFLSPVTGLVYLISFWVWFPRVNKSANYLFSVFLVPSTSCLPHRPRPVITYLICRLSF